MTGIKAAGLAAGESAPPPTQEQLEAIRPLVLGAYTRMQDRTKKAA